MVRMAAMERTSHRIPYNKRLAACDCVPASVAGVVSTFDSRGFLRRCSLRFIRSTWSRLPGFLRRKDALAVVFFLVVNCGLRRGRGGSKSASAVSSVFPGACSGGVCSVWQCSYWRAQQRFSLDSATGALILAICQRRRFVWQDVVRLMPFFASRIGLGKYLVPNTRRRGDTASRLYRPAAASRGRDVVLSVQGDSCRSACCSCIRSGRSIRETFYGWLPSVAAVVVTVVLWRYCRRWGRALWFTWLSS